MPAKIVSLSSPSSLRVALSRFDEGTYCATYLVHPSLVWRPHEFIYLEGPRLEGEHIVAAMGGGLDSRFQGRAAVRVDSIGPPSGGCTWPGHGGKYCEHRLALIRDLAASPELRDAILAGQPPEPAIALLAAGRLHREADLRVSSAVALWTPERPGVGVVTLEIGILDDPFATYANGGQVPIALRFRVPPSRRTLDYAEVEAMRLHPDMRRLLTLGESVDYKKRGVVVGWGRVSSALEILRVHPEWGVQGAQFAESPLRMVVARAQHARQEPAYWAGYGKRKQARSQAPTLIDVLEARWRSEDGSVEIPFSDAYFFGGPSSFVRRRGGGPWYPVDPTVDIAVARKAGATPRLEIPSGTDAVLYRQLQARLRGSGVTLPSRGSMGLPEAHVPDLAVRIDGTPLDFLVVLEATYATGTFPIAGVLDNRIASGGDASRNDDLERAAVDRLVAAGLLWDPEARRYRVRDEDAAVVFWESGIGKLRGEGAPRLDVYLSDRLAGMRVRSPLRSKVRASLVGNWFETRVSFEADDVSADMEALRDALAKKRRWVLLRDGSIAQLAAGTEDLAKAVEALLDDKGEGRLSVAQVGLLEHWAAAAQHVELDARVEQLRARLRTLDVHPAELPAEFRATLRPYQVQGLAWLQFLDELGTGGILADDMGLGKTLMTLAFLAKKKESQGAAPSLVVCPTSVVGNWIREAAKFTPGLSVLSLAGSDRGKRFAQVPESDVVVTTYALLRIDAEQLQGFDFRAVVLDEAQNIKNAQAATTHAARGLRGQQKLALTGTPVENRLGELWSILEYCNPGMLGSERSFQGRFERPIAESPGSPVAAELRARVRPFVLRRSKAQVLTDLPPKEEIDVPCLPGPAQRRAYDVLADMMRRDVETSIATKGFGQSGIMVLTALLRLRQMCCDPRLVDPSRPASQSAKREAFLSLVRELVAEGRRALVFSQFVELLHLWRADLDREGIEYVYLDGSTIHRDQVVSRFQDGKAPLFLLSLKAGGSGLNLTAADTVIHCDPWWNPAVEAQATDRTHRIGQTRSVTVYRLVLRGTIEEKIAELKARKRAIADAVIREEAGEMRGLDANDVRLLLSGVDSGSDVELTEEEPSAPVRPPARPAAVRVPPAMVAVEAPKPSAATTEAPSAPPAAPAQATEPAGAEQSLTSGVVDGPALQKLVEDIRAYLKETGATQRDYSARAGLSQSKLSRLLNGYLSEIDRPLAARMLRALLG